MTARDELATHARAVLKDYGAVGTVLGEVSGEVNWGDALFVEESDCPESIADAVLAAGWRKMPSRDAVIRAFAKEQLLDGYSATSVERLYGGHADAVLALMDGDNE
jgi:hypothetical protein